MALLGSLMLGPSVVPDVLAHITGSDAFSSEGHAAIYKAVMDCYGENPNADAIAFRAKLEERGQLAAIGGDDYLRQLMTEVTSAQGAGGYAKIVAERYRRRRLAEALDGAVRAQGQGSDAETVIESLSSRFAALLPSRGDAEIALSVAAREVQKDIAEKTDAYLPSGLPRFDEQFGGIPKVGVITILGVPGAGKSTLALNIVLQSAILTGVRWRVFSFEVGATQIAENALSALAQVPIRDIRRRGADPADHETDAIESAIRELDGVDIAVVERNLSAEGIGVECTRLAAADVRAFVIDYAQNVAPSHPQQPEREKLAALVRVAQEVSRLRRASVILISQPTLDACREDRPLRASDVKGAQELWAGSDLVLSVYRSAAVRQRQEGESQSDWERRRRGAEIHVVKNKHGPIGMVRIDFRPEILRFSAALPSPNMPASDGAAGS